jgi:16S rRNA (guanine527-N7)-methyltransferase
MNHGGLALLHKGKQALQEVAHAQQTWSFELEDYPSFTDPDARLLAIQRITARG